MSCYQILDKHTIIDMFCSIWVSHRISYFRVLLWCDIALRNPFSQNKSKIVCISQCIWNIPRLQGWSLVGIALEVFGGDGLRGLWWG